MNHNSIRSLLEHADADALREIAEKAPCPFDEERMLRRSLEKYYGIAQTPRPARPVMRRTAFRTLTAAACLLLTVGLGVGIWSKQQKIMPAAPRESSTVTVTETRTEQAPQPTTQPSSEAGQTETPAETPAVSSMLVPASEAAILTSAAPSETAPVIAASQTETASVTVSSQKETAVTPSRAAHAALPQTSVTAPLSTAYRPATPERSDETETVPATSPQTDSPATMPEKPTEAVPTAETAAPATECLMTEPSEDWTAPAKETCEPIIIPTEPCEPTLFPTEPMSINESKNSHPEEPVNVPHLRGFVVRQSTDESDAGSWSVLAEPQDDDPPDCSVPYSMTDERFRIISSEMIRSMRIYRIYDTQDDRELVIRQECRQVFRLDLHADALAKLVHLQEADGIPAFRDTDYLYWDDGSYILSVRLDDPDMIGMHFPALFRADLIKEESL